MADCVLVLTWCAVLCKAPGAWRRSAPPARRALWVALLALALGWTLRVPPGYRAFDERLGVANLAQPVGDALALATGCAILGMLLYNAHDPATAGRKLRVLIAVLAAAALVMGISFSLAGADVEADSFVAAYGGRASMIPYWLAYLGFAGYVFVNLTRVCGRYAQSTGRRFLRLGLRLIQGAGVLGLLYVLLRVTYLVATWCGLAGRLGAYGPVSTTIVALTSLVAVIGATLPAVGGRWELHRAYRQLHPLWAALYRAVPGIALTPPPSRLRELASLSDLEFRLLGRVVEIRDARLALKAHFRADVADRAHRLARQHRLEGDDLAATVEAATLAAAVADKTQGRAASTIPATDPAPGGASLDGELLWLRKVSRAFAQSPLVRESAQL